MKRKIVAIQANTHPTRWVSSIHKRFDMKVSVEFTDDKNQAKDFSDRKTAEGMVAKIFNPFDRVFTVMDMSVTQPLPLAMDEDLDLNRRRTA
jgi:hypothetical protein